MQMKVTVDQDICASSGNCVMNAPELFDQREEDGVVVLLNANPSAEQAEGARRAAAACPALAIYLEE
jgi:ferredoxin